MQRQHHSLISLLKACAKQKDLQRGSRLHASIVRAGLLEKNVFLGSALISMYAKCQSLAQAQEVFDKLPVRNVVSWNALITGYVQHSHGEQALKCFERMQLEGPSPDLVTFVCMLKACGRTGAVGKGKELHTEIVRKGLLKKYVNIGNALIDMYMKCGLFAKAQEVFDELPIRDVITWNALLTGYVQCGHADKALDCFEHMLLKGLCPDAVTYACILKACGSVGASIKGAEIHTEIVKEGLLKKDVVLGNALVDMYAKCGLLTKAQEVFEELPIPNVVSCSALMAGYVQCGHCEEAIRLYGRMEFDGILPNAITYISILKACGSVGAADKGKEIHAEIVREGLLKKDTALGNALVDMYMKCGQLAKAQEVFDELRVKDLISWSTLMAGYAQHGCCEEALKCFELMQFEGISPDAVTYICILKVYGSIQAAGKGKEIYDEIVKKGLLQKDTAVGNALVDMYAKCGLLGRAQEVFDKLPQKDVVSWSALMTGYAQHGNGQQALQCFERMQLEGVSPDSISYTSILKTCGDLGAADKGKEIHVEIVRKGLLLKDVVLGNALVDMYAKCGLLAKAQQVFDQLPFLDEDSWSVLMAGYAQHGDAEQALKYFEQMQLMGIFPNAVTYICVLKACGSIGASVKGKHVHAEIVGEELLIENIVVGNALVDMYVRCGLLVRAHEVFNKLPVRDVISWSALMAGYALLGEVDHVFYLFERMLAESIKPDVIIFTIVLNACRHSGLLERGEMCFTMMRSYDISPTLEHYSCMIDLFARAGHLEKAVALIKEMPFSADITVWLTVLSACQKLGNLNFGRMAFEHAVQLDRQEVASYICMSNLYIAAGRQKDADEIEAMRMKYEAQKKPEHCLWTDAS